VLLCDEPTGALDYETGKLVLEVIAKHQRRARHHRHGDHAQRGHRGHGAPRVAPRERPHRGRHRERARKLSPAEISW
jgi:putative ABC transport system ATP-binding protein